MSEAAMIQELRSLREHIAALSACLGSRLTTQQAADHLGVHRNTIATWRRDRGFPSPDASGKYRRSDVIMWEVLKDADQVATQDQAGDEYEPTPIQHGEDGHHLYRHFDKDGVLLYVGVSQSALHRLKKHRHVSPWFKSIAKVDLTVYKCKDDALIAERQAIKREKPLHNITHSGKKRFRK